MKRQDPIDLRTKLSRRRLLGGLGALTVALTSPIWRAATVFGKDAPAPAAKRFIGIFSANGTIASEFFPAPASSPTSLKLPKILAPLEAHKAQLMVLKGVHMNSTIEELALMRDGIFPGYTVTEPTTFDH